LLPHTLAETKADAWGNSFLFVASVLGTEWRKKYWLRERASMMAAAKRGYVIVPVQLIEA